MHSRRVTAGEKALVEMGPRLVRGTLVATPICGVTFASVLDGPQALAVTAVVAPLLGLCVAVALDDREVHVDESQLAPDAECLSFARARLRIGLARYASGVLVETRDEIAWQPHWRSPPELGLEVLRIPWSDLLSVSLARAFLRRDAVRLVLVRRDGARHELILARRSAAAKRLERAAPFPLPPDGRELG